MIWSCQLTPEQFKMLRDSVCKYVMHLRKSTADNIALSKDELIAGDEWISMENAYNDLEVSLLKQWINGIFYSNGIVYSDPDFSVVESEEAPEEADKMDFLFSAIREAVMFAIPKRELTSSRVTAEKIILGAINESDLNRY